MPQIGAPQFGPAQQHPPLQVPPDRGPIRAQPVPRQQPTDPDARAIVPEWLIRAMEQYNLSRKEVFELVNEYRDQIGGKVEKEFFQFVLTYGKDFGFVAKRFLGVAGDQVFTDKPLGGGEEAQLRRDMEELFRIRGEIAGNALRGTRWTAEWLANWATLFPNAKRRRQEDADP